MLRLVITNQRGGDAKTTTTTTLARYFADQGRKVLILHPHRSSRLGIGDSRNEGR